MDRQHNYWMESVAEALNDAEVIISDTQLQTIVDGIISCYESIDLAFPAPPPDRTPYAELLRISKNENAYLLSSNKSLERQLEDYKRAYVRACREIEKMKEQL